MANVCDYKMVVKGRKSSCYAFVAGQNWLDYKEIEYEEGTDEDYEVYFTGTCKWSVDAYCGEYTDSCPVKIPDNLKTKAEVDEWCSETFHAGYNVKSRSKMFSVDVQCNSRCTEGDPETAYYIHYKNGEAFGDNVPGKLVFEGTLDQKNETLYKAGDNALSDEFMKSGSYTTKFGNTYKIKDNKLYLIDSVGIPISSDRQFAVMTEDEEEDEEYLKVVEKINTVDEEDDVTFMFSFAKDEDEKDSGALFQFSDAVVIENILYDTSLFMRIRGAVNVTIWYKVDYNGENFLIKSKMVVYNEACLTTMLRAAENLLEKLEFDGKRSNIKRVSNAMISRVYSQIFSDD